MVSKRSGQSINHRYRVDWYRRGILRMIPENRTNSDSRMEEDRALGTKRLDIEAAIGDDTV